MVMITTGRIHSGNVDTVCAFIEHSKTLKTEDTYCTRTDRKTWGQSSYSQEQPNQATQSGMTPYLPLRAQERLAWKQLRDLQGQS